MNNRSIIEGGLAAFFLSMLLGMLVVLFFGAVMGTGVSLLLIVINWFCLAGGGWWAATRSGSRGLLHGMLSGMIYLNVSIPLNIFTGNQAELTTPVVITSILNSTFFGALGGFWAERKKRR